MTANDDFADEVVPLLQQEVDAVHHGDIGPRLDLWSRNEPITLLGAWFTSRGWADTEAVFRRLAETFRGSEGTTYEVLAAELSGDLGYVVGLEHNTAVVTGDEEPRDYTLRVTTIFRREDGWWKVVHRHGDSLPLTAP
jgi:ketosteroid isomerase-like protein